MRRLLRTSSGVTFGPQEAFSMFLDVMAAELPTGPLCFVGDQERQQFRQVEALTAIHSALLFLGYQV